MKPIVLDLRIAKPCHESWNAMTPASDGRHCASCDKTVIDVTAMSPAEATTYLSQQAPARLAQGEHICVRARANRQGTLLRPGIQRRLLTNGMAVILAAAGGFAALSDLHAADDDCAPLMGKPTAIVEPMMDAMVMDVISPVTDAAIGITVRVDADAKVLIANNATGTECWRLDLTTCGMTERPDRLTLAQQTVSVFSGTREVVVDIRTGKVFDR